MTDAEFLDSLELAAQTHELLIISYADFARLTDLMEQTRVQRFPSQRYVNGVNAFSMAAFDLMLGVVIAKKSLLDRTIRNLLK